MEMDKTMVESIRSKHFGRFLCQPLGENTFAKNAPKTKMIPNIVITWDFIEFRARTNSAVYAGLYVTILQGVLEPP